MLRAGGRLGLAVWGSGEGNPWLAIPMRSLMAQLGVPEPEPGLPGVFALADRENLGEMIAAAGFEDAEIAEVEADQRFEDFDSWLTRISELGRPFGQAMGAMDDAARDELKQKIAEAAEPYRQEDGGYAIPSVTLCARAS